MSANVQFLMAADTSIAESPKSLAKRACNWRLACHRHGAGDYHTRIAT